MTQVYQNATKTVLLRLFNESTGAAMTGITYDQVTCSALKSNGTQTDFSPLVGEWSPCASGAAAARGFYRLTVAAAAFDVLDDVAVIVNVPGSQCPALRFEVVPAKVVDVQTRLGAPAGATIAADIAAALAAIGLRPQLADMIASELAKQAKIDALDARVPAAPASQGDVQAVPAAVDGSTVLAKATALQSVKNDTNSISNALAFVASDASNGRLAAEAAATSSAALDGRVPALPASQGDVTSAQTAVIAALPAAPDNAGIAAMNARLPAAPASQGDVNAAQAAIVEAMPAAAPTVAQIADAVHDEQLAGHLLPGSAGRALAELKALKTCFVVDDIERNPQTLQLTARLRGFASRADALAGTNPLITLENVNVAAVDQRLVRSARVTEPAP